MKTNAIPIKLILLIILYVLLLNLTSGFKVSQIDGDWIVTGSELYTNQTIVVGGNLIIAGGNLTLNNVTLIINSSFDGEHMINVTSEGIFNILNNSTITPYDILRTYRFQVFGSMTIIDSKVSYMWGDRPRNPGGIEIYSNNVVIVNSLIEHGKTYGISILGSSPNISYNTIKDNDFGIGVGYSSAIISSNNITSNTKYGIYCSHSSPNINNNLITRSYNGVACSYSVPTIVNNTITDSMDDGVWFEHSNGTIANNMLLSNKNGGVDVTKNSNPLILNNTIRNGNYEGIFISWYSNPVVLNNDISNYPDGIFSNYFSAPVITGNKISSNSRGGIRCSRSSISAINNTISNNYLGVLCSNSNISITDSAIINSTLYDIYLTLNANLVSLNTAFNKSKVYFNDGTSSLTVKWYLDINVTDDENNSIIDSTFAIYDANNEHIYNGTTDVDGRAEKIRVEEYMQNAKNFTFFTPHTISAAKKGFQINHITVVVNSSKNVTLTLNPRTIEEYPFVIANGSEIFVSYKKYSGRDNDVYFVRSLDYGSTWDTPVRVVTSTADEIEPIMAAYGSNIYLVYEGNVSGNFDIWFTRSTDSGISWSVPVKLDSSPGYEGHPYIIVDNLGVVYVTYDGDRGIWSTKSVDAGNSWSSPVKISKSTTPEWNPYMAVDEFGVYLTYTSKESGYKRIWFSKTTDGGNSWSSPIKVDPGTAWQGRPAMAVYNGEIYVTYSASDLTFPPNSDVKFTKSNDGGLNWSFPIKVYESNASEFRQSVVADAQGVYVDYQGNANGNWDIWFTKSSDRGNTWFLPIEVEKTQLFKEASPQLTVENGTVYVVYSSYLTNYENVNVWFSRSPDGGSAWSIPIEVGVS
ncbi:MAG: right-handed parallel beta-helix repeat-containing protein [Candidatus Hodarchaeales archaeon]|jgi:parallel beta-helix repeat protein